LYPDLRNRDVEADLRRLVGNKVKVVVIPLRARLVLQVGIEDVKPSHLQRVVKGMNRAAVGEAGQRLHVGIFFAVMAIAITEISLVIVIKLVVETRLRPDIRGYCKERDRRCFRDR
jgi:hypothetical protein